VAGPSSSGKSELSRQLVQKLPGTSIVSLDSYYRGMEEIPLAQRTKVNFDHPAL
jgi:uridine kinase